MKYNWDFWKYCSPTQHLTFTKRRPRSKFLWIYNKCFTMFHFSTGVSKIIWGKHSYSVTKSWFILSSLGFKAQTIPFVKPKPSYITISLQVNYKSHLYPTPTIYSLLLQIRTWTILKDKSGPAQLMNLSKSFTYERILNLVSPCSYLQKWWFHRCHWIKYQRKHATFTVKYAAQGKIKINITESFHKKIQVVIPCV